MRTLRTFLSKHSLWVGFLAAFLPLLLLIALQSRWLMELRESSRDAQQTVINNYLEAVTSRTEGFYTRVAERALNLPPSLFSQGKLNKAGHFFKKRDIVGARRLFVYNLAPGQERELLVFAPGQPWPLEEVSREMQNAVWVACAPFWALAKKQTPLDSVTLASDERDPAYRTILLPISDEWSRLVGVAGMIIDEDYFRDKLLSSIIEDSTHCFFSGADLQNVLVTVRDGSGEKVISPEDGLGQQDEVRRGFSFVFTDYQVAIRSRHRTAEQWASANFELNITLSILVAVLLLGGIILALRTALREIKLSQMKTDFVSNVSHELRTPLASIRVFGEFLRLGRTRTPEKVREYGEFIEMESRRLTRLINNILDFSRIESGRKDYNRETIDLREVMDDTLRCFDVRLRKNGFTVIYDEPQTLIPSARVDRDAITQALANLIDNAVKYSGDSREIVVGLGMRDDQAQIWVQDFGIGISRQEREHIFDRFHRVGSSLKHDVKGFGLGLSIVAHIVEAHGGTVTVSSKPEKGSTFTINLPLCGTAGAAGGAPVEEQGERIPTPGESKEEESQEESG